MLLAPTSSHYARRFGLSLYPSVHLGNHLRFLRVRAGYTQGELARRLGVDAAMTSRWECESSTRFRPVPGHHFQRLSELLEVPLGELTGSVIVEAPAVTVFGPPLGIDDLQGDTPVVPQDQPVVRRDLPRQIRYTSDGADSRAMPAPGRPGMRPWRIACWNCHVRNEIADPDDHDVLCSSCSERLRARVTVHPE